MNPPNYAWADMNWVEFLYTLSLLLAPFFFVAATIITIVFIVRATGKRQSAVSSVRDQTRNRTDHKDDHAA